MTAAPSINIPRQSGPALRQAPRGATIARVSLYLAVFLSPYLDFRLDAAFFTISDVLFCLALLAVLVRGRIIARPLGPLMTWWVLAFLLTVAGLLLSSLVAGDPVRGIILTLQYAFCFLVLPYVLYRGDWQEAYRLLIIMMAGVVVLDVHGIVTFVTSGYTPGSKTVTGAGRLATLLGNPNTAACLNAMMVVCALWLQRAGRLPFWLAGPALAIFVSTIVMTSSNTGLFATVVALLVYLSCTLRLSQFVIVLGLVVTAAATIVVAGTDFLPASFQRRVLAAVTSGEVSEAGTFVSRAALMQEALDLINGQAILFIGIGGDQFRDVSVLNAPVHNAFLLLWAEGGILSLAGWLTLSMLGVALWLAARARGVDPIGSSAVVAIFSAFIVAASASPHMYARYWFVALLLAMQPSILALLRSAPARPRLR